MCRKGELDVENRKKLRNIQRRIAILILRVFRTTPTDASLVLSGLTPADYKILEITTTENFKCLQWNSRGLTKSKLEEFRHYLSLVNPEVALLSEKHWNSGFAPKFKTHHILRKDCPNRLGGGGGGGVAIY